MKTPIPPRALLPAVLLLCLSASATTMLSLGLPELTRSADAVVQGTVRRVESRWSGDGRRIVTDVEIQVSEALKGQPGSSVLVTQSGGRVGDLGQKVSGEASFALNEEVVVFLERKGPQGFRVLGMAQGKYQVQRSPDGTRVMAVPDLGDLLLLDPTTHQPTTSAPQALSLTQLKSSIHTALGPPTTVRAQEKQP